MTEKETEVEKSFKSEEKLLDEPPPEAEAASSEERTKKDPKHPIALAIDKALHRFRDIEAVARLMVPVSAGIQKDLWDTAHEALSGAQEKIDSNMEDGDIDQVLSAEFDEAFIALDRLSEANLPETLLTSLFLGLFSAFDAFSGNLLQAIYGKRPELLNTVNIDRPLSELLQYGSFEDLKEAVLFEEIEKFRRKSYVEQFTQLETRFGINLRKFDHWKEFVELGQRRNLITHCEGVVSKQYIRICKENEVVLPDELSEGQRLKITPQYLFTACSVVYEVSLKLGQTLWRKVFPDEHDDANEHLTEPIYEALRFERWDRAILLSEFAASVQKEIRDLDRRIRVVNLAIALCFSDKKEKCRKLLSDEDWSAAALDFRLAVEVLHERFDSAAEIMRQIGKKGDLVNQKAYHVWPLFREFRRSEHFVKAYEEVFESSYGTGVAEAASKAEEKQPDIDSDSTSDDQASEILQDEVGARVLKPSLGAIKHLIG